MLREVRFTGSGGGDFFPDLDSLMDVSMYDWYIDDVDLNYFYYNCPAEGVHAARDCGWLDTFLRIC